MYFTPITLTQYVFWALAPGQARAGLPDDNSEREPPDPISNSEVKLFSADDSVAVAM